MQRPRSVAEAPYAETQRRNIEPVTTNLGFQSLQLRETRLAHSDDRRRVVAVRDRRVTGGRHIGRQRALIKTTRRVIQTGRRSRKIRADHGRGAMIQLLVDVAGVLVIVQLMGEAVVAVARRALPRRFAVH